MGTISRCAINKWKTGWFSKGLNTSHSENYRKSWMNHALIYNKDTMLTHPAMQEHCCSFIWLSWTLMDKTWGGWVLHCERWAFASIWITFSLAVAYYGDTICCVNIFFECILQTPLLHCSLRYLWTTTTPEVGNDFLTDVFHWHGGIQLHCTGERTAGKRQSFERDHPFS